MNFPLMGFTSTMTYSVGAMTLPVYLGERWKAVTINVNLIVVDVPATYKTILGLSTLNLHCMVHFTYH